MFPCQLVTDVFTEMIAVLGNQVIRITIIAFRVMLYEFHDLITIQTCSPKKDRLPKVETWALPGLNLKDTTVRIVMRTKCILYTMNCQTKDMES